MEVPSQSAHQLPSGRTRSAADFLYYKTFALRKVSSTIAEGHRHETSDMPERIPEGSEHSEDEGHWVPCTSYEDTCVVNTNANVATVSAVLVVETLLTEGIGASDIGVVVIVFAGDVSSACRANLNARRRVGDADSPLPPC